MFGLQTKIGPTGSFCLGNIYLIRIMDTNWPLLAIFIIGIIALIGFFVTKKKGFGRFATSTLLLLLVTIMVGLFYAAGKMEAQLLSNILFSIIGFAGGLFTSKEKTSEESADKTSPN